MSKLIYTAEQVDLFGEYNQTKLNAEKLRESIIPVFKTALESRGVTHFQGLKWQITASQGSRSDISVTKLIGELKARGIHDAESLVSGCKVEKSFPKFLSSLLPTLA
jgi:hypothetical protein